MKNRINRYLCNVCKKTFTSLTCTLFNDHKISICEWIEYCQNKIQHLSIKANSWNNKNPTTASKNSDNKFNPLKRINELHSNLRKLLNTHMSFNMNMLQNYLNIFPFIMNPPSDKLEKVKYLLHRALTLHRTLTCRKFYAKKTRKENKIHS